MSSHIVVIETAPWVKKFTQVVCLMSEEELELAKAERPDLIFKVTDDYPDNEFQETLVEKNNKMLEKEAVKVDEETTAGISIRGMTLPSNLDYLINKVLGEK